MHNRFSLPVFLTAFLVCGAALWDFVPHAHACSPAIVTMGLDVGDDIKEYLDPMPLDGSWAFPATRVDVAQKENQSEIVVTIAVQNDRDGDVNGRVTFVPMSQKFVDADYETQELLVVWTPDQPLTANTTFHVTVHYERRRGDDVVDEWEKESSFFTQDAATTDEAAAWVDGEPKASYTETPAYDMQCEEKEPCTSCGCGTLFWSTRYAYRPTLDMTLSFPLVPNPRQQYVVVEDDAGTIYDVHWTYQETADLHYTFDEDTALPVCLNVKTYTLSSDSPFASSRICANDEDFPTL